MHGYNHDCMSLIHFCRYQCSPLSTTGGILQQFEIAKRYDENSKGAATVLVLDEVGLAEYSPDMPLKVLHGMLVNPAISIIGVSNWVLDPAKMNRCICLQRPTPSMDSLLLTGTFFWDVECCVVGLVSCAAT